MWSYKNKQLPLCLTKGHWADLILIDSRESYKINYHLFNVLNQVPEGRAQHSSADSG